MEPPTDRPFPHRPPLPPFASPSRFIPLDTAARFRPPPLPTFLSRFAASLSISPLSAPTRESAVRCLRRKNEERKEKSEERKRGARDRARTLPRVSTISNRPEALEIRFGRLMIGTGGSGRSSSRGEPFLERPPGDRKETSLSPVLRERERGTRRSCLDGWGEGRTVRRMSVIYSDARFDSLIAGK